MTKQEQLKREYEEKLAKINNEQANCNHEWGEVVYDPEIKSEPIDFELKFQGSDCYHEPTGYHDVEYKRWSRTCKKCGKVEYTKEQVATKFEPKF